MEVPALPIDPRSWDTTITTDRASYDAALAMLERELICQVNQEMSGQDPQHVHDTLVARFRGRLPQVALDDRNLLKISSAIAKGTLGHRRPTN